jgi:hypothetical protein
MTKVPRPHHRVVLPALPLALASASTVGAAVVYTNPADLTSTGGNVYWDMGSNGSPGSASMSTTGSDDFVLTFGTSYSKGGSAPTDLSDPRLITQGGAQVAVNASSKPGVKSFAAGETIGGGSLTFNSGDFGVSPGSNNSYGDFSAAEVGYVGLAFNAGSGTNYGWAQIGYSGAAITLYDFAYESDIGVAIEAGATSSIPEPSAAAGLAGLLAGSVALYSRRRRQPLAA